LDKQQKQEKIVDMFDQIASTYDLANRVLSFGIDISWRKKGCNKAFEYLGQKNIEKIVDVATGTGDLLLHWKTEAEKNGIRCYADALPMAADDDVDVVVELIGGSDGIAKDLCEAAIEAGKHLGQFGMNSLQESVHNPILLDLLA